MSFTITKSGSDPVLVPKEIMRQGREAVDRWYAEVDQVVAPAAPEFHDSEVDDEGGES